MLWIRFDEQDHYIPAPDFCLTSHENRQLCLSDLRGDCSVVVVFWHGSGCLRCLEMLESFVEHRQQYQYEGAQVLAVSADQPEALAHAVEAHPRLGHAPLVLLSDPQGMVRRKFTGLMAESLTTAEDAVLFVLDAYNAPYSALVGRELDEPSLHHDTVKWLEYVGTRCPE